MCVYIRLYQKERMGENFPWTWVFIVKEHSNQQVRLWVQGQTGKRRPLEIFQNKNQNSKNKENIPENPLVLSRIPTKKMKSASSFSFCFQSFEREKNVIHDLSNLLGSFISPIRCKLDLLVIHKIPYSVCKFNLKIRSQVTGKISIKSLKYKLHMLL